MKMLTSLLRQCSKRGIQHWSPILRSADKSTGKPPVSVTPAGSSGSLKNSIQEDMSTTVNPAHMNRLICNVGPWDKKFLVWSGQYKSPEDVPNQVAQSSIHKARDWARIRLNLWLLFFAMIGCGTAVYLGKNAWRRGETVEGNNLEWHRKINEQHRKDIELQKQKELLAHPEPRNIKG